MIRLRPAEITWLLATAAVTLFAPHIVEYLRTWVWQ
jgi:hypothetical protein